MQILYEPCADPMQTQCGPHADPVDQKHYTCTETLHFLITVHKSHLPNLIRAKFPGLKRSIHPSHLPCLGVETEGK